LWSNIFDIPISIEVFVYAQTISYGISFLVILGFVLRKSGFIKINFSRKSIKKILSQSYPFALLILLMSFFNRFDSVLLERLLENGKSESGIYAQSFRVLDAANMFAVLIAGMLLPIFSRMLKQKDEIGDILQLAFSIVIVPAISLGAIGYLYNNEIIELLYNEHLEYSARVFSILINGFIFIATSYIFGTLLTANGSLKTLNILAGITVLLNFSLNIWLIPRFKAPGAAVAALISQGFYAISQIFAARFHLRLNVAKKYILKFLLYLIGMFLMIIIVPHLDLPWLGGLFLLIVVSLILSWIFGLISPRKLFIIIKYDR
jgi:O-antigen/teichoic acid export membrane protein